MSLEPRIWNPSIYLSVCPSVRRPSINQSIHPFIHQLVSSAEQSI